MKIQKTVLIDMDATLVDILTPWLSIYNNQYYDNLTVEDIKDWDIHKHAKCGEKIYNVLNAPGFVRDLEPYPYAIEFVKNLRKAFEEVVIVTAAAEPHHLSEKAYWIKEHLPFLTKKDVVYAHKKYLVDGHFLIDDSPENAHKVKLHRPNTMVLGIRFPYNQPFAAENSHHLFGNYTDPGAALRQIEGFLKCQ